LCVGSLLLRVGLLTYSYDLHVKVALLCWNIVRSSAAYLPARAYTLDIPRPGHPGPQNPICLTSWGPLWPQVNHRTCPRGP